MLAVVRYSFPDIQAAAYRAFDLSTLPLVGWVEPTLSPIAFTQLEVAFTGAPLDHFPSITAFSPFLPVEWGDDALYGIVGPVVADPTVAYAPSSSDVSGNPTALASSVVPEGAVVEVSAAVLQADVTTLAGAGIVTTGTNVAEGPALTLFQQLADHCSLSADPSRVSKWLTREQNGEVHVLQLLAELEGQLRQLVQGGAL